MNLLEPASPSYEPGQQHTDGVGHVAGPLLQQLNSRVGTGAAQPHVFQSQDSLT